MSWRHMRLDKGVLEPAPQLTDRQIEVLRFIWSYFMKSESYPTHREIAAGIGAQSTNVAPWLNALVRKGVLTRRPGAGARNIRLTALALRVLESAGALSQGTPIKA